MICTFCGTENREGNRFCGMCGVRLERRKVERRSKTDDASTECSSCGHLNEPGYKFCGMCGDQIERRTLERRGAPEKKRASAMANAQLPTPESRRAARDLESRGSQTQAATMVAPPLPERQNAPSAATNHVVLSPSVSGPSFLGLNDAPAQEGEYLLEDEQSSGRGLRFLVLLVVLVAIAGLIFVQYRANFKGSPKSPEMPKPEPAGLPRPAGDNRPPVSLKPLTTSVGAATTQAAAVAVSRASPADTSEQAATTSHKTAQKESAAKKQTDDAESDDAADPVPNKPSAALVKAKQYLHGQGVRQNCEQGMVYLRAATRQNDPDAAVQMGTLYASGFCVQQDRVKAYQWFSTAREMEPENRWIAKNLNQLWAQMTPQERGQIR
ncbi:MAG TPA: zinc ribbon domain-containing protein [Candidatus Angelobacter sp.]